MSGRRTLRERLSQRRALIALLQTHPSSVVTELAAVCGYDIVVLDDEHGLFSQTDHLHALQTLAGSPTAGWVRLRTADAQAANRYLDLGADGIVVPGIETAEHAAAFVRALHYPPVGTRGFGASVHRRTRFGVDVQAHLQSPLENCAIVPMIESPLAVANAEAILSVDGVDGAIVGPSDLSANLSSLGDFATAAYTEAMTRIAHAGASTMKLVGTVPHAGYTTEKLLQQGHRLFIAGADTMVIREALQGALERVRSQL